MSLSEHKITDSQIAAKGVTAAPDKLTGTAAQNKMLFDRLIREAVKDDLNGLIDELSGEDGAAALGAKDPDGNESTVQDELDALDAEKQDAIDDLDDIREGAEAGATAYQKPSGGIPKTDLASGVRESLDKADSALQAVPNTYRTAAAQDVIDAGKQDAIDDLDDIREGAEAGATAYQKPSGGIPKTDLASGVRESLDKADSALQSVPSTYRTAAAQDALDADKYSADNPPPSDVLYLEISDSSDLEEILAQIDAAIAAGKPVFAKYNNALYVMTSRGNFANTTGVYNTNTGELEDVITNFLSIKQVLESGELHYALYAYYGEIAKSSDLPTAQEKAAWNGKYAKPSGGIPKTDLASGVRESLDKADSALQAVPSTYRTAAAQDVIDAGKVPTADYAPTAKTTAMTQPVGKDADGKLWTAPGGGGVPTPSSADNGKFLRVVNGAAAWETVQQAENRTF